jgi:hypothetical protein
VSEEHSGTSTPNTEVLNTSGDHVAKGCRRRVSHPLGIDTGRGRPLLNSQLTRVGGASETTPRMPLSTCLRQRLSALTRLAPHHSFFSSPSLLPFASGTSGGHALSYNCSFISWLPHLRVSGVQSRATSPHCCRAGIYTVAYTRDGIDHKIRFLAANNLKLHINHLKCRYFYYLEPWPLYSGLGLAIASRSCGRRRCLLHLFRALCAFWHKIA